MRLGQIARRLAMSPSEIVQYLASRNSAIDDNANARLSDDQVDLVLARFAPHLSEVINVEVASDQIVTADETVAASIDVVTEEIPVMTPQDLKDEGSEVQELSEVIKAPKVTLTGLKVLGKIELPEPKKKESTSEEPKDTVIESIKPERKTAERRRTPRDSRAPKNPIALQRERELNEELEKKKQRALEEKERKTQNYLKKVKHSPPTKAMRLIDEPTEQLSAEDLREEPKSWFGKFIKWLST